MKKITRLILFTAAIAAWGNVANAQSKIDFETVGQDWAWTLFENGDNAPTLYSVVANPSNAGINTSVNSAKYVINANGQPWAGLWSDNVGSFTFTAENCKVKVMVYKNVISNFGVKFEGAGIQIEKLVPNTKINEWEELTYDFSSEIGKTYTKLVLLPDFPGTRTAGSINYWDNISFNSNAATIQVPAVGAPTPTVDAAKVISVFSDTYTNVVVSNLNPNWGQSTIVSTVDIAGNPTLKYANFNYQGTEFATTDVSAMKMLHVDVWTADETSVKLTAISPGAEMLVPLTPLVLNAWNSFDIPLSSFTGVNLATVFQFKFAEGTGKTIYVDNLYFYDNANSSDTEAPTAVTATKGAVTFNSVELLLNATDNSGAVVYDITYGTTTVSTGGSSAVQKSYIVTGLDAAKAYSFSVVAKDASNNKATAVVVEATTSAAPTAISVLDYETVGQDWTWTLFSNGDNAPTLYSVVANPSKTGINTSDNVAKYVINTNGDPWAGLWRDIPPFVFTAQNCKVKVMVYKDAISNFGVKFEGPTGAIEKLVPNTVTNQWEELTYDFSSEIGKTFNRLVFLPDFPSTRTAGSINYWDNLSFNTSVVVVDGPATAAPTPPTRSAAKVVSIFSDAYTNVDAVNFNPNWGQSTVVSTIQVAGNNTLKYAGLNYQGTEFPTTNALTMNKLHVDVWTKDGTLFQITPISAGPKEKLITLTPLNLNGWNSYDIDLSQFTGVSMSEIFQFKIVGAGTFYIDNLYLYDSSATVDTEIPTAFTATKGLVTSENVEVILNATDNSGALNYEISYGTTKLIVGGVSGVQKSYIIANLLGNTDYSFSIVAKDPTGNAASNTITITAKTAASIPAAPTPTRAAANVISIFSDAYTNIANTNFFPGWGQATAASTVTLAVGNQAMKYATLNYQGMELGSHVNAGSMAALHIDVYTENETSLKVTPISPGKELLVALAPLALNTWNSFDIPLTSFTGVNMTDVFQFKFEGSGGKTVYLDNIYFHDGSTAVKSVYADKSITIFPTSVADNLNIKSEKEISLITVRNLLGQALKTVNVVGNEKSIDVSNLSAGNYLVSVKLTSGLVSTYKIIKL